MENLDIKVGLKLKKVREELKLTVREVGERTGIHFTYVGKIENGKLPSLDKLNKLCELYGISVQSLFGEDIEVPKELKAKGVKWISFIDDMENRDLSPEDIQDMVNFIEGRRKKT